MCAYVCVYACVCTRVCVCLCYPSCQCSLYDRKNLGFCVPTFIVYATQFPLAYVPMFSVVLYWLKLIVSKLLFVL